MHGTPQGVMLLSVLGFAMGVWKQEIFETLSIK